MDEYSIVMVDVDGVVPKLDALGKRYPKQMRTAEKRAASVLASRIRNSVAKLNVAGTQLPKRDVLTVLMHGKKSGGVLTTNRALCRVMNVNGRVGAGYITNVEGVFRRWQDGGAKATTKGERHAMHIMLGRAGKGGIIPVPRETTQPARPVIAPLATALASEFPRWVLGAFSKLVDREGLRLDGALARQRKRMRILP